MLTLTRKQMEQFRNQAVDKFVDEMKLHLLKFFPEDCHTIGPAELDSAIRFGIGRAKSHGFETRRDVCKYLNLMFTFGREFDEDPECYWAREIMVHHSSADTRMDALYVVALRNAEEGQGYAGTSGCGAT